VELHAPKRALTLGLVVDDVASLLNKRENRLATFQVASQLNCLEFVGPDVTPERGVAIYSMDHTQGPACSIACGPATVYRNYFVPLGDQVGQSAHRQIENARELLAKLGEGLVEVRGGYTLATDAALRHVNKILDSKNDAELDELRGLLRVGVHSDVQVALASASRVPRALACSATACAGYKQQLGADTLPGQRPDRHAGVRAAAPPMARRSPCRVAGVRFCLRLRLQRQSARALEAAGHAYPRGVLRGHAGGGAGERRAARVQGRLCPRVLHGAWRRRVRQLARVDLACHPSRVPALRALGSARVHCVLQVARAVDPDAGGSLERVSRRYALAIRIAKVQ
jgi:hypothetical protein